MEESRLRGERAGGSGGQLHARRKLEISIPKWCGKWVVPMDEFRDGVVGAKSKNLAGVACRPAPGLQGQIHPEDALRQQTLIQGLERVLLAGRGVRNGS